MNRPLALLFSVISVALMSGIGISISYRQGWLVLAFSILSIAFIGFGFAVKARLRRKQ